MMQSATARINWAKEGEPKLMVILGNIFDPGDGLFWGQIGRRMALENIDVLPDDMIVSRSIAVPPAGLQPCP